MNNKFKKSDYYKSEEHIKNILNASILGNQKIQELKEERIQEYNINPKLCKFCNEPLSYKDKRKIFCNSSCAAKYNNSNRIVSEESKNKTKNTLIKFYETHKPKNKGTVWKKCIRKNKNGEYVPICDGNEKIIKICEYCGKEFEVLNITRKRRIKNCSKECSLESMKINVSKKIRERVKNGTHKGWQSRNITSYPEKFFISVLKNNNLFDKCKVNFKIKKNDLGLDEEGNYFLDFYFLDKKIDLEIDGKQHNFRKEHDEKRDQYISNNGIIVYRIKWKSINNDKGKKYIKNEIDKFLDFYNNI